jgi:hypothetical protein
LHPSQARAVLASINTNVVGTSSAKAPPASKRRTMSKEARKRIADAQRTRWIAQKAGK